jgi:hypothetical protein
MCYVGKMSAKCDMLAKNGAGPLVVCGIRSKSSVSDVVQRFQ